MCLLFVQNIYFSMEKAVQITADVSSLEKQFCFKFIDSCKSCKLEMSVAVPFDVNKVKELTQRLINFHNLPVYVEEGKLYLTKLCCR